MALNIFELACSAQLSFYVSMNEIVNKLNTHRSCFNRSVQHNCCVRQRTIEAQKRNVPVVVFSVANAGNLFDFGFRSRHRFYDAV